uniref:Uncharacterized protein n=1 Tax=Timspurckia oligopyrenoides TaxID=708627 RepID=A0A7S0ZJS5_9RHOD|mmetsp:Transcript_7750/g.14071  ORF Transcript_7750/g.14071 Transcript_7750/m.14071 type:complete len:349 (+) Transcript_7750:89-1135(+)
MDSNSIENLILHSPNSSNIEDRQRLRNPFSTRSQDFSRISHSMAIYEAPRNLIRSTSIFDMESIWTEVNSDSISNHIEHSEPIHHNLCLHSITASQTPHKSVSFQLPAPESSLLILLRRAKVLKAGELLSRSLVRTLIYCLYDILSLRGLRDSARIGKILVEAGVDELLPASGSSFSRQCCEYLVPCGVSAIMSWTYLAYQRQRSSSFGSTKRSWFWLLAFRTLYRMARQAVIYRLFYPIGSKEYYLLTVVALIGAFFREECLWDLFRIKRWPSHFSVRQGNRAVIRTIAYTLAFSLPIEKISKVFQVRRRRGNAKKLTFFASWIIASRIYQLISKNSNRIQAASAVL